MSEMHWRDGIKIMGGFELARNRQYFGEGSGFVKDAESMLSHIYKMIGIGRCRGIIDYTPYVT